MTWFKLDDNFPRHPKVMRAGTDAAWLFVAGGCYCAQYLTDGFIPRDAVPGLTALKQPMKLAARLVEVGLWHDEDDAFEVHDYLDFNPSREQVESGRKRKSEAGAMGAAKRWGSSSDGECDDTSERDDIDPSDAPVPLSLARAAKRGTRLPEPWEVTPEMIVWVEENCPGLNWQEATRSWMDHWRARPGQKGVMLDWVATWRNGMRNAKKWGTA